MHQTADIVIAGGGIIGLSLGRVLARQRLRVLLIDRGLPGTGASSAAAGMLTALPEGATSDAFLELCRHSLAGYRAWCDDLREATGIDVEFRDEGSIHAAACDADARLLAGAAESYRAAGLEVEILSPDEAGRREPLLTPECRGAIVVAADRQVHTRRLIDALLGAAEAAGVRILRGTAVRALDVQRDRVIGLETSQGRVAAVQVVIAAGAWSADLGSRAGIPPIPVRPVKGEIVCLGMRGRRLRHVVHGPGCYLVPRRDGRLLIGATEVDDSLDVSVTAGAVHQLLAAASRIVPAIADYEVLGSWAGLRPTTPDRLPIIGPGGPDGLLIATGHYRKGILLAPETARLLADCTASGQAPPAVTPFALTRFTRNAGGSPH
jgi:glycine oxidase